MSKPFYSMARYQDFWLIYTEVSLGDRMLPLYLAPTPITGWEWTTDQQGARRFQYSYQALTFAYDKCPFKVYRSELPDGLIEIDFENKTCTVTRGGRSVSFTLSTLMTLRDLSIPGPARSMTTPNLPIPLPAPKETSDAS